jgi:hypothetical protein
MINNKLIQFIVKKPFTIFEIDNFLNIDFYNSLRNNFPKIETLNENALIFYKNKKISINSDTNIYKEIINNNITLNKFDKLINGEEFKKQIFYKLFSKIIFSRGFDIKHFFKILKFPKFEDFSLKKSKYHYLSLYNKMKTTIQFSYILNGGMIVPHKDATDKLITLMLYFPESEKEYSVGTSFWETSYKNQTDQHLDEEKEKKNFFLQSKEIYKSEFRPNKIIGFIKNNKSWHSVEKFNLGIKKYIRKSININFYY